MKYKSVLILFCLLSFSAASPAQQLFNVKVKVAADMDISKVQLWITDGMIEHQNIGIQSGNNIVSFKKQLYSERPELSVLYPRDSFVFDAARFLLLDTAVEIHFIRSSSSANLPFKVVKVKNAVQFEGLTGYGDFDSTTEAYMKTLEGIFEMTISEDSMAVLTEAEYFRYLDAQLRFIKASRNTDYAFLLFKNEVIVDERNRDADSMIELFNLFPLRIKSTYEGKQVFAYLHGLNSTKKGKTAPLFNSVDISGTPVSLADYRGKFVILNFWASWCVPCLEELPQLRKLYKEFDRNDLQIISISHDSDSLQFIQAVKNFQIDWIKIFGDGNLINQYGKRSIPAVYLLDRSGEIIFSRSEDAMEKLFPLLEQLHNELK